MPANKKNGVTPVPWLRFRGKFLQTQNSMKGEYKVTRIGSDEAAPLIEEIDETINNIKKSKLKRLSWTLFTNPPYEEEVDDQGNLRNYLFKFKQKAKINTKDGRSMI